MTVDEVRADAEAEYGTGDLARACGARRLRAAAAAGRNPPVVARKDVKVPMFLRLYRVESYAEAAPGRAESLEVLAKLLGGDTTSALYRRLVVERRLATDVGAYYDGYTRDAGEFGFIAHPRPGVPLEALEHAIDEVVAPYLRRAPSKAELARAKTQLVAGVTFRRDSQFEMASAYGQALAIGLTVFDVQQWPRASRR